MKLCHASSMIALLGVTIAVGCGSKPIPMHAVAGTTITIAIPNDFPTGYGRRLAKDPNQSPVPAYVASDLLEDPQRGELVFDLYTTGGSYVRHLQLAYITRVNMSPQSRGASAGSMLYDRGQTLAFVNIPHAVAPPGSNPTSYLIKVFRYRRMQGSPDTYELKPVNTSGSAYLGWGDDGVATGALSSPAGIPIKIVAGDGADHFTPTKGWGDVAPYGLVWGNVGGELEELVPYPDFDLVVPQAGSTLPRPAAWEAQITYPKKQVRIRGVELRHPTRSAAIVRWEADPVQNPPGTPPCGEDMPTGVLNVKVIDPDLVTSGIRIAYELRNFDQPCGGRANSSTFQLWPGSFKAYDLNGVDITSSMTYEIPASAFF